FIDLFLACVTLGAIVVPINVLYRQREIAHIVADAEPFAVVARAADAELFPLTVDVWAVEGLADAIGASDASPLRVPPEGDAPAALVYTSGTTGKPKGAILSHDNFIANAVNLVTCWRFTSEDRYLAVLPLFHVHGLGNGVCGWLASGCVMRL